MSKYISEVGTFECEVTAPLNGWIGEMGGTPYVGVPVKVVDPGIHNGEYAVWQGWLTEAAFDRTIARLTEVFGFDGDLDSLSAGTQTLAGKKCSVETKAEEYRGKTKIKIAWLNRAGGSKSAPLDTAKLSSLLNGLTSRAKAVAKQAAKEAGTPIVRTAAPANEAKPVAPVDGVPVDDLDPMPF